MVIWYWVLDIGHWEKVSIIVTLLRCGESLSRFLREAGDEVIDCRLPTADCPQKFHFNLKYAIEP